MSIKRRGPPVVVKRNKKKQKKIKKSSSSSQSDNNSTNDTNDTKTVVDSDNNNIDDNVDQNKAWISKQPDFLFNSESSSSPEIFSVSSNKDEIKESSPVSSFQNIFKISSPTYQKNKKYSKNMTFNSENQYKFDDEPISPEAPLFRLPIKRDVRDVGDTLILIKFSCWFSPLKLLIDIDNITETIDSSYDYSKFLEIMENNQCDYTFYHSTIGDDDDDDHKTILPFQSREARFMKIFIDNILHKKCSIMCRSFKNFNFIKEMNNCYHEKDKTKIERNFYFINYVIL